MKGAIYLQGVLTATIRGSTFENNDPGPILENLQMIGLEDSEIKEAPSQSRKVKKISRATGIFLWGDRMDVKIESTTFSNNMLDFATKYLNVKENNPKLYEYFPPDYF